jgi:hypothetical protein
MTSGPEAHVAPIHTKRIGVGWFRIFSAPRSGEGDRASSISCHRSARPDDPVNAGAGRLAQNFRLHRRRLLDARLRGHDRIFKTANAPPPVFFAGRRGRP